MFSSVEWEEEPRPSEIHPHGAQVSSGKPAPARSFKPKPKPKDHDAYWARLDAERGRYRATSDGGGGDYERDRYGRPREKFDGKRMRKPVVRKTVNFNGPAAMYLHDRYSQRTWRDRPALLPATDDHRLVLPSFVHQESPGHTLTTKFAAAAVNKNRCPVNALAWTPEGRRLITGTHSGEFTLWNGLCFNFETILQAHDYPIRRMLWSHSERHMITADDDGVVKYWLSTMNNVKAFQAHKEPVRDLCFSPSDQKFASASDDGLLKVWDFLRCICETRLEGHGHDVKSCDWHASLALVASGAKDHKVRLWDPKTGRSIETLWGHKHTVSSVRFSWNGSWLATGSRDHTVKIWDLRMMREFETLRGHPKEITCLDWHPTHETVLASGGFDGSLLLWNVGGESGGAAAGGGGAAASAAGGGGGGAAAAAGGGSGSSGGSPAATISGAHEASIWDMQWHPLGHVLATASHDNSTRFWCRPPPGDPMTDKFNLESLRADARQEALIDLALAAMNTPGRRAPHAVLKDFDLAAARAKSTISRGEDASAQDQAASDLAAAIPGLVHAAPPASAAGAAT